MAKYYSVFFDFPAGVKVPVDKIKVVANELKDWLRFSPEAWLFYSDIRPSEIRDRLKNALRDEDPSILILESKLGGWTAYSKPLPREWLKKTRTDEMTGE